MSFDRNVGFLGIVGDSPAMREVYQRVDEAAAEDIPVLVTGSTGTGKEGVARAIHLRSPNRSGPFVSFSCLALSPELMARELFGHDRGAFTGAGESRLGFIEKANHGTLFFDEVGDASLDLQGLLLRVIQEKRYMRVGSTEEREADTRFVFATNADLDAKVDRNEFRLDFLMRIRGEEIQLPDLAERGEDFLLLAAHFLAGHANRGKRATLSEEAISALRQYSFPGHVRELEQMIYRAVTRRPAQGIILPKHLGFGDRRATLRAAKMVDVPSAPGSQGPGVFIPLGTTLEEGKRLHIQAALRAHGGNKVATARELGVDRSMLQNFQVE